MKKYIYVVYIFAWYLHDIVTLNIRLDAIYIYNVYFFLIFDIKKRLFCYTNPVMKEKTISD